MRSFEELLQESSAIHGHHCAGQVLGVRMAMVGCRQVGIDEPKGCKKLVVYVEVDRCATDAVQAVTGCSLGKRTLKFLDHDEAFDDRSRRVGHDRVLWLCGSCANISPKS